MLNILPPISFSHHPALGCHFAVSEAWTDDAEGRPLFLFFRDKPTPLCRMMTQREFNFEKFTLLPKDWRKVDEADIAAAAKSYQSVHGDYMFNGFTDHALNWHFQSVVHIKGYDPRVTGGWYRAA